MKGGGGRITRSHSKTETARSNLTALANNYKPPKYIPLNPFQMCAQINFLLIRAPMFSRPLQCYPT